MAAETKQPNIRMRIAQLQGMELSELQAKWREVYGKPAPNCGWIFLRRQLAFRIQELHYGGLSRETREGLVEIGNTPKLRPNPGGVIPGTCFERDWKGKLYVVTATAEGFEMNGQNYKSLSGAASAITGTQWSGKKFFGVK